MVQLYNAEYRVCHYSRVPVNSCQLVARSIRRTANSSTGRLVTRSTRHKEAANSTEA